MLHNLNAVNFYRITKKCYYLPMLIIKFSANSTKKRFKSCNCMTNNIAVFGEAIPYLTDVKILSDFQLTTDRKNVSIEYHKPQIILAVLPLIEMYLY